MANNFQSRHLTITDAFSVNLHLSLYFSHNPQPLTSLSFSRCDLNCKAYFSFALMHHRVTRDFLHEFFVAIEWRFSYFWCIKYHARLAENLDWKSDFPRGWSSQACLPAITDCFLNCLTPSFPKENDEQFLIWHPTRTSATWKYRHTTGSYPTWSTCPSIFKLELSSSDNSERVTGRPATLFNKCIGYTFIHFKVIYSHQSNYPHPYAYRYFCPLLCHDPANGAKSRN